MRGLAWSGLVAAAILGSAVAAMGADREAEPPWPGGRAPTAEEVDELIEAATELDDKANATELLEAFEKGEAYEETFVIQEDIDAMRWDTDRLFRFGDDFFAHEFLRVQGYGAGPTLTAPLRVHKDQRGGLDNYSCAGCHSVGGPNGAGSFAQNTLTEGDGEHASSTNPRQPLAILGSGFVDMLSREMTADLQRARTEGIARARATSSAVTVRLTTKDVDFGSLAIDASGKVDTNGVSGVSSDLVVRPFGWKGTTASIRRFAEAAARIHFGLQSSVLVVNNKNNRDPARLGDGPNWYDPDNDGVGREFEEGTLSAVEIYASMLEVPVVLPPSSPALQKRWARGGELFETIGCTSCHKRHLRMVGRIIDIIPDTTKATPYQVDLLTEGDQPRSSRDVELFSDLRRHDMGPGLADPHDAADGVGRAVFMTRRLWGLAETAPYLHDGRAATIPEAILAHGGEAKAARDAFAALPPDDQANVHVFLLSLTRASKPAVTR